MQNKFKKNGEKNMKKIISIITAAGVISAIGAATIMHSKANVKMEKTSFTVTSDRTRTPSAHCKNADGSGVGREYSTSDSFCICKSAKGNMSYLSYDGIPAYCIGRHNQNAPLSATEVIKYTDIPYDSEKYGAVFRIASAGASTGTTEYGLNENDLYYVTQCALRSYLYNLPLEYFAFFNPDGSYNESMTLEYRRLLNAVNEPSIPEFYTISTDDSLAYTEQIIIDNRPYLRYGPYSVYSPETEITNYTVKTDNNDNAHISVSEDIFSDSDYYEFNSNEAFYIFIDSAYQDEINVSVNSDIYRKKCEPVVFVSNNDTIQDIFQIKLTDTNEHLSCELKLQNRDNTGDVQLNKKFIADGTDIYDIALIEQPRFSIKSENGLYINGVQTSEKIIFDHFSEEPVLFSLNADSTLSVSGLPTGNYFICEVEGAEGYTAELPEILVNNTPELNTCEIINVSETTPVITTTEVTTTETTTETTTDTTTDTTTEITTSPNISTFTITESSFMTEITTPEETTVTTFSTTPETTVETTCTTTVSKSVSTTRITPLKPKLPSAPKTGESGYTIYVLIMSLSSSAVIALKTLKKI